MSYAKLASTIAGGVLMAGISNIAIADGEHPKKIDENTGVEYPADVTHDYPGAIARVIENATEGMCELGFEVDTNNSTPFNLNFFDTSVKSSGEGGIELDMDGTLSDQLVISDDELKEFDIHDRGSFKDILNNESHLIQAKITRSLQGKGTDCK